MHQRRPIFAAAMVGLLAVAACNPSDTGSPRDSVGPNGSNPEPLGGSISILASWTDTEQESFLAMIQPWADANNVEVQYEGNRDLSTILTTRVEGGNPPDVAGLPNPGAMAEFARNGDMVNLGDIITDEALAAYNEGWIADGTVDGQFVGIWIKIAVKGLIWYNPAEFSDAGYDVPSDWSSFDDLVEQIRGDGAAPWGIGLESGADSGWPGTDWIEDFMLRQAGPDLYDQWWQGSLAWSSPEVKAAFEAFGRWAADAAYVNGGPNNVLSTNFGNGGDCLFAEPPDCYLHHQASFISSFFETNNPDTAVAGETYDFFAMPGDSFNGVTTAGDLFGMFNDTPQARSLLQYLVTAEAQQIWVERGGAISANRDVPLAAYPDSTARKIAEIANNADVVRFDAGDKMPAQMGRAFFGAILDYLNNPADLDAILADLDDVQAEAYAQ